VASEYADPNSVRQARDPEIKRSLDLLASLDLLKFTSSKIFADSDEFVD
jgi:hypothetical protein